MKKICDYPGMSKGGVGDKPTTPQPPPPPGQGVPFQPNQTETPTVQQPEGMGTVASSALLAAMSDRENKLNRIGFLEGVIEGIRLYAIWRDGEQLVGCMERPLKEVLQPYKEELDRLMTIKAGSRKRTEGSG